MLLLASSYAAPEVRLLGDIFAEERGDNDFVIAPRSVMNEGSSPNSIHDDNIKPRAEISLPYIFPDKFVKKEMDFMSCSRKVYMAVKKERIRMAEVYRMMEMARQMERDRWNAEAMFIRPGYGPNYYQSPSWIDYEDRYMGPPSYTYGQPYMFGRNDEASGAVLKPTGNDLMTPVMGEPLGISTRSGFYRPDLIEEMKKNKKWTKSEKTLEPNWNRCYTPDCRPSTSTKNRNNGINGLHT